MPEHQKVQKKSQKIQGIQDERRNMQKENVAAEEEMQKLRDDVKQKEERILFLSDKVERNKMVDAKMAAELQEVQAGRRKKRQQRFVSGGLLHGDDGGTVLRCGSRSGEVQVRCNVPGVHQEIRGLYPFCADARKRETPFESGYRAGAVTTKENDNNNLPVSFLRETWNEE